MKKFSACLMLAFSVLLIGCATPYKRNGLAGGFSETRLQENIFTVCFRGNGYCSQERAQDFAMLRCAEVTLEYGYKYFALGDSSAADNTMLFHSGSNAQTYGTISSSGSTAHGTFNTYNSPSYTVPIRMPNISYTIFCSKEKPEGGQVVLDATFLANSIRRKYGIVASNEGQIKTEKPLAKQPASAVRNTVQGAKEDSAGGE